MSFSHEPLNRLFAYDSGTSYAAPRVARLAALVEHQLREQIGRTPHPNLIRAILAASARIPSAAQNLLEHTGDSHAIIRVCGYGLPNEEYALQSNDRHAVLYAQSDIPLNTLHIYRVPVPDCMLQAPGGCRIKVALAFDPPVLARRMDYLGIKMDFRLIRGKTVAEVVEAYSKGKSENKKKAFAAKYSVSLKPNKSKGGLVNYDRGNGTLQCAEFSMKNRNREHYGNDYCLLIRSYKRWFDDDQVRQSYAVVVSLEANTSELYAQVRQRVRQQVRVRA